MKLEERSQNDGEGTTDGSVKTQFVVRTLNGCVNLAMSSRCVILELRSSIYVLAREENLPARLVILEKERLARPKYPTCPELQVGGPGSCLPPPYLVATGQAGHAVVGIDIGTRFSRIATYENCQITHLTAAPIPSIACRGAEGNLIIGMPPAAQATAVIQNFRHLIGSDWYVEAGGTFFSAEMFTEQLVARLSLLASNQLGRPVSKAVLTVPVTFNSAQRRILRKAAESAGLDVLQLINEPTAAAFAHCFENPDFNGTMLVYYLGAGSFSASIMEMRNGILEVKASSGNDEIGGNAYVGKLMNWMTERFEEESDFQLERNMVNMGKLQDAAEQAIDDMHMAGQANIKVTQLQMIKQGVKSLNFSGKGYLQETITSKEYLKLIYPLIESSLALVDQVTEDSRCITKEVNQILIVGDWRPLVPMFQKFYERFPAATIWQGHPGVHPVNGAALQAALLSHNVRDYVVWDVVTEPIWSFQNGKLKQVVASGTPLPVTAYHKSESPDATVNVNVVQGKPDSARLAPLAEVTINNCPPTTEGETKVEIQFIVNADGIVDYRAKHIGLDSLLPITVLESEPFNADNAFSDTITTKRFDDRRLERLARIMNLIPLTVLNVLRSQGYSIEHIKDGRAIESMLRRLKKRKKRDAS